MSTRTFRKLHTTPDGIFFDIVDGKTNQVSIHSKIENVGLTPSYAISVVDLLALFIPRNPIDDVQIALTKIPSNTRTDFVHGLLDPAGKCIHQTYVDGVLQLCAIKTVTSLPISAGGGSIVSVMSFYVKKKK